MLDFILHCTHPTIRRAALEAVTSRTQSAGLSRQLPHEPRA